LTSYLSDIPVYTHCLHQTVCGKEDKRSDMHRIDKRIDKILDKILIYKFLIKKTNIQILDKILICRALISGASSQQQVSHGRSLQRSKSPMAALSNAPRSPTKNQIIFFLDTLSFIPVFIQRNFTRYHLASTRVWRH